MEKTLGNTSVAEAKQRVSDLKIFGDGDGWQLICKASSQKEGWMKSTKAMQIDGVGCIVQVTTQQANAMGYNKLKRDAEGKLQVNNIDNRPIGPQYDYEQEAISYVIAESVTFVPGAQIEEILDENKKVTGRKLVAIKK